MMGVVFNTQNSQLVIWSLLTEKSFRHGQNRPVANLSFSIFVLSHEKCYFQSD